MRAAKQWMEDLDPAWADTRERPELSEEIIKAIQIDSLNHACGVIDSYEMNWGAAYNDLQSEIRIIKEK